MPGTSRHCSVATQTEAAAGAWQVPEPQVWQVPQSALVAQVDPTHCPESQVSPPWQSLVAVHQRAGAWWATSESPVVARVRFR